jgi:hypothetical protein
METNDSKYNVYNALGTQLQPVQSVWVRIPGGIFVTK